MKDEQAETIDEMLIFGWAQEHKARVGSYPLPSSGLIVSEQSPTAGLKWSDINVGLQTGQYGLAPGLTLRVFIESHHRIHVRLTEKQIIQWAKLHRKNHKEYPDNQSGSVEAADADGETWANIDFALRFAQRGLEGHRSLAEFLYHYETRNHTLSPELILSWADDYCTLYGSYPKASAQGIIPGSDGKTWRDIDKAIQNGTHGLPKHKPRRDLYDFLERYRDAGQLRPSKPNLTIKRIVAYAAEHFRQTGERPHALSGKVSGTHSETWAAIDLALRDGARGFAGGSSLQMVLDEFMPNEEFAKIQLGAEKEAAVAAADPVVVQAEAASAVVQSASANEEAPETLIHAESASLHVQDGMTVADVNVPQTLVTAEVDGPDAQAPADLPEHRAPTIRNRTRKAPARPTAARRAEERTSSGKPGRKKLSFIDLNLDEVLGWIDQHKRSEGYFPSSNSGKIEGASGFTWSGIDRALKNGELGRENQMSLSKLIEKYRPRNAAAQALSLPVASIEAAAAPVEATVTARPPSQSLAKPQAQRPLVHERTPIQRRDRRTRITFAHVKEWVDEYHEMTGAYPTIASGKVHSVPGVSWRFVAQLLERGNGEDIPAGGSLSKFIFTNYGVIGGKIVAAPAALLRQA